MTTHTQSPTRALSESITKKLQGTLMWPQEIVEILSEAEKAKIAIKNHRFTFLSDEPFYRRRVRKHKVEKINREIKDAYERMAIRADRIEEIQKRGQETEENILAKTISEEEETHRDEALILQKEAERLEIDGEPNATPISDEEKVQAIRRMVLAQRRAKERSRSLSPTRFESNREVSPPISKIGLFLRKILHR